MKRMPATTSAPKRLVLMHAQGPYKGTHRIMGIADPQWGVPEFFPQVEFETYRADICLVKVTPRYALYHEIIAPSAGVPTFNASQR